MKILIETAEAFDMRTQLIVTVDGKVQHAGFLEPKALTLLKKVITADFETKLKRSGDA